MNKNHYRGSIKKINNNKKIFIGFILGIVVSSITVYAVNTYSASTITFKPSNSDWKKEDESDIEYVSDALDSLYKIQQENSKKFNSKLILLSSGWKKDTGWNTAGISVATYIDNDYLTKSTNTITVKKDCKITIRSLIQNVGGSTTSNPQYQLYYNGANVKSLSNGKNQSDYVTATTTINAKANDTFYVRMNGGGGTPTYNITTFEVVLDS